MFELKIFSVYFFVDIVSLIMIPVLGWILTNSLMVTLDFSYFAWYLLTIPVIVNVITFFFLKKNSYSIIYLTLFLIFSYVLSYYLYSLIITDVFSRLNFFI